MRKFHDLLLSALWGPLSITSRLPSDEDVNIIKTQKNVWIICISYIKTISYIVKLKSCYYCFESLGQAISGLRGLELYQELFGKCRSFIFELKYNILWRNPPSLKSLLSISNEAKSWKSPSFGVKSDLCSKFCGAIGKYVVQHAKIL